METTSARKFTCVACARAWTEPYGTGRPVSCPSCGSANIHRSDDDRGPRGDCGRYRAPRGSSTNGRGRGGDGRGPRA